jgi:predicted cupin superfamily sugar epimerase
MCNNLTRVVVLPEVIMLSAKKVQELLNLQPLRAEGGYFSEMYRSKFTLSQRSLPSGYFGERALSTAIYYMLTPDTFSVIHRLKGDEVYHFYLGDPAEMLVLKPDGTGETVLLGPDIVSGMRLQQVVPAGAWQGSRLVLGGKFALMGTTMSPGFDPADFEIGVRDELSARYPEYAALIAILTRTADAGI